MAKMFYSMEETCEKLGKSEAEVLQLVDSNQLSKFVDGDKLIFKVDQVDLLAGGEDDEPISLAEDSGFDLANDDSDAIGLADDAPTDDEPKEQTGISIFDADEIEEADAAAQTQITSAPSFGMETAADPAASGSGLLDMTREADDTSLGADLLDDLGADTEASTVGEGADVGGGTLFEEAATPGGGGAPAAVIYAEETISPMASGAAGGAAAGLAVALAFAFALIVAITTGAASVFEPIMGSLNLLTALGATAGAVVVFTAIGALVGKMTG